MTEEAGTLLTELLDWADDIPGGQSPWEQWTAVLVFLAEAAIALGDAAAARRLRPRLAPYSGQQLLAGTFIAVFGPADAYLAALDSLLGDADSARLLFQRAVAQAREFGAPVHEAAALTAWAVHLSTEAGRPRRAAGPAAEVGEQAWRLAAGTGQVRLQRRLRALDTAAAEPGPDTAGLTPREMAVLRLLAEGSSNRHIAARLKISENTAANHVRSILTKTGAANRTQAAAMALSRRWLDDAPSRPGG